MKQRRIAQITSGFRPTNGGQEILIDQMNNAFAEMQLDTTVIQLKNGWPEEEHLIQIRDLFSFIKLKERSRFAWSLKLSKINLKQFDTLIFHYAISWLPFIFFKKKMIVFSHGIEWDEAKRGFSSFFKRRICQYAISKVPQVVTVANDLNYLKIVLNQPNLTARPCSKIKNGVWYIPNPVDFSRFSNASHVNHIKMLNTILMPRNVVEERGLHIVIEAFAMVLRKRPELHLVVMGEVWFANNLQYGKYISSLIKKHDLGGKVIFLGSIPWQQVPGYYKSALISVIATTKGEGTSLAALESMASGTPVVSSKTGGLSELPTLKAELTPEDFCKKMLYAIENREILSKNQSELVKENYDIANWKKVWKELFNDFFQKN